MDAPVGFCGERSARGDCRHCVVRHISLCSHVGEAELEKFQALSRRKRFDRGKIVLEQDQKIQDIYVITRGLVRLYRHLSSGKRQIVGFLGPGDLLGSIKRKSGAHCAAQAITEIDVCCFKKASFSEFLMKHPNLCYALLVTAMDEIEAQYEHSMLLGRKQAPERLAAFILLLNRRWVKEHEDENLVHIEMSRNDIGDHLGLTSETISRTFSQFKAAGLIQIIDSKRILLKNHSRLQQLAGFEEMPTNRMSIGL